MNLNPIKANMTELQIETKKDAEFIIRAINSHDDLVAALKKATTMLANNQEAIKNTQFGSEFFSRMLLVISKAEGK